MPCAPGMSGCKATCLHRAFVMEHRYEMEIWLKAKDIGGLGYAEETRDWMRDNPAPRLQDRMTHREKAPDVPALTEPTKFSSQNAEETLLAMAMHYKEGVKYVEQLSPEEFQHPLSNVVARTIVTLERSGVRASSINVENHIRDNHLIPQDVRWDSSLPEIHEGQDPDRSRFGLQSWEMSSTVPDSGTYLRDEIRAHYQAYQVDGALSWGQTAMSELAETGITKEKTKWVADQVGQKLASVKPDFPGQLVSRLTVQKSPSNRLLPTTAAHHR